MTWLFNSGATTQVAQQTGQQVAAQTAAQTGGSAAVQGSALNTGMIGQSGITNPASVTPAYSAFPDESAALAKFVAHPVDTTVSAAGNQLRSRMGMTSGTGSDASGANPPQTTGAAGILHGMLSARKTSAPSAGTGEPPPTQSRPRQPYQRTTQSIDEILAQIFGGQ